MVATCQGTETWSDCTVVLVQRNGVCQAELARASPALYFSDVPAECSGALGLSYLVLRLR